MKLVDVAIRKPVSVTVGVILLALFGLISLFRIPIQLTPNVDLPQISVETIWTGSSPVEVEREIIDVQEEELKNLDGLDDMRSESRDSMGTVDLLFEIGTDPDVALLRVSNKLDRVKRYPADAEKPIIRAGGRYEQAIAWMVLTAHPGYEGDLSQEYDFCVDQVKPRLERIPGVASSNVYGGQERELQVVVDLKAMAARGVTIPELTMSLDLENRNVSAGNVDEGKRRYVVRTVGEFVDARDVAGVIVKRVNGIPVSVGDVAEVRLGYEKRRAVVRHEGVTSIVFNAVREPGSNVLVVMKRLDEAIASLNEGLLKERGIAIKKVYDETRYIQSAIDLVRHNILLGGVLAVAVLLLFLRSLSSTVIVSLSIPISVVGTFLLMNLFGRNINVVSLAGISFAIGMLVDNSIVVFENIFRHREMGKKRWQAAYDGTVEVWGAVVASTLTTIAVFVPIVFVEEEAGQLFRDIAIAISSAVTLSLMVSITVIPSLSSRILGKVAHTAQNRPRPWSPFAIASGLVERVSRFVYWICGSVFARFSMVVFMTTLALAMAWFLMPKTEYLPEGDRDMLFAMLLPPPGYNLEELVETGKTVEGEILPLVGENGRSELAEKLGLPAVSSFFYVGWGQQVFMGIGSSVQERTRELFPYVYGVLKRLPGMIPIVFQPSLFARGASGGRTVEVEIKGPDLERLIELGGRIYGALAQLFPNAQIRPIPGLDLGNPELRVVPDRDRLTRVGLTTRDLGITVDAFVDGARASHFRLHGDEIDLVVMQKEPGLERIQDLTSLPLQAPGGERVTVGSVAEVRLEEGPMQINHIDSQRAIILEVRPPRDIPLETIMDTIEEQVLTPLREGGELGSLYRIDLKGAAEKLTKTRQALQWNFVLAVVISYLLMCALFENFLYPLVIMFSVPLAAAGGFIGLYLLNRLYTHQALDIITMLGFVILVGIVVNNAILIVHQTLNNMRRYKMPAREAIAEAVRTRMRPIFMSAVTSICGMMPLVVSPGAGSEFYRGIGSVVVGGLAMSTLFTLFLIPSLLSLALDGVATLHRVRQGERSPHETIQTNRDAPSL